jgi:hypothetical protein
MLLFFSWRELSVSIKPLHHQQPASLEKPEFFKNFVGGYKGAMLGFNRSLPYLRQFYGKDYERQKKPTIRIARVRAYITSTAMSQCSFFRAPLCLSFSGSNNFAKRKIAMSTQSKIET